MTETTDNSTHIRSLVSAIQELSLARNLETVMRIVRTKARELTGADGASFVLRDKEMCYYADEDAVSPLWKGQRFPLQSCISGWSMINRCPAIVKDIYTDDRIPIDAYRPTFVKSLVMVPIRSMDPIGAIGTYWAKKRIPEKEEISLLQSLADVTAVSMENIRVYNELDQRVKERTIELIDSLNREKEINALKTRFVSMASHEFRTPLGTILSSTSLLETYIGKDLDEQKAKHTNRIKSSVKHLISILSDFLSMDKLEQNKTDINIEQFDLSYCIGEVIEEMEGILKKGQHIDYHHTGGTDVHLDKKILHSILLNLISNAIKYSPEDKAIDIFSEVKESHVTIKIRDHGIGIPETDQPHVFSDFFRAQNTKNIQGTGLGLPIVRRYVELLNGAISFNSETNQGSCFILEFGISNPANAV